MTHDWSVGLSLFGAVCPEGSEGCGCLSVYSTGPYTARQDVIEKMLIGEL